MDGARPERAVASSDRRLGVDVANLTMPFPPAGQYSLSMETKAGDYGAAMPSGK